MAKGVLTVKAILDSKQFKTGVSKMKKTARGMESVGKTLSTSLSLPIAAAGGLAIKAASDFSQSAGAIESVLGDASGAVEEFGKTAAKNFGLSRTEVNQTGAVLAAQLQSMGFSADEAAGEVVNLQKRAADMAATFGGTTAQALEAIGSLMRGERDPIEQYGVSIKQADINARLAAQGLTDLTAKEKRLAESQAAMTILMQQTANVEGQFARESGTLAGKQARLTAQLKNMAGSLGAKLIPIALQFANVLKGLLGWFNKLSPAGQTMILVIGGIVAAIGPVLIITAKAVVAFARVKTAFIALSAVVKANPWIALIAATIALVALIIANWDKVKAFLSQTWEIIKQAAGAVWDFLKGVFKAGLDFVVGLVMNWTLPGQLIQHWDAIEKGVQAVVDFFKEAWNGVIEFFGEIPAKIGTAASGMWDGITDAFKGAVNTIIRAWNDLSLTLGGQSVSLPFGLGFTIPSITLSTPNIPTLHSGGMFRAPTPGGEGLALLKDREMVTPDGGGMFSGANFNFFGLPTSMARDMGQTVGMEVRWATG